MLGVEQVSLALVTIALANGLEIRYETFGNPEDPTVLLIMGLGGQLIAWDLDFCGALADRGYFVIRFDNRDSGLSEKIPCGKIDVLGVLRLAVSGRTPEVPYFISDMARDGLGLLDALEIESAHLVGVSMGGMIAQSMAILSPKHTRTLTSIMSTTGDPGVGLPSASVSSLLFRPPPAERSDSIEDAVEAARLTSPVYFDEEEIRQLAAASYDRSFYPEGTGRQLAAILASGDRSEQLQALDVPTLVIHGRRDSLVNFDGGEATARAIPNARLVAFDDMGHDLPRPLMGEFVELLAGHFQGR